MADSDNTSSLAAKTALLHIAEDLEIEQNEMTEKAKAVDISKQDMRGVPDVPDYPSCDYCGEEFAGKLFCSQCRCAFYCSKVSEMKFTEKV